MASSEVVNWGIVGPGRIAARLMKDVGRGRNCRVVAAASRDLERAREFAARFGVAHAYSSYEELLADREVDSVYITLPNATHHPMTMAAIAAGKHVLCEKPYTRHADQVTEAFDAADAAGLRLMEAFMWRHSPQARRLMELLPEIGEVQWIRSVKAFPIATEADLRLDPALDGGSLMDVGCYPVSGSRLVAGTEPVSVYARQVVGESGVDIRFAGMLMFASGLVAEIMAAFTTQQTSLEVVGTSGTLALRGAWDGIATELDWNGRPVAVLPDDAYRLELENLSDAILGRAEPLLGRADALGQARTIEALYRSAESGQPVRL
jgi:D-xylose 1-dehydrogenase (NADP+, D-xylono-1,5-lactone-forming)